MASKRVIAHLDLDAFFASVEQRDNPALQGKPVVVGADPQGGRGRGVVSTCSYEARKYGVHSAMPISQAYQKCPHAIFLPPNFEKYSTASQQVFKILYDFTPDIEPISIDEAFLDLTGSFHFWKTPLEAGRALKERIKNEIRLTASVGIAPVKMVAKIASDFSKPDGLLEITEEKLFDFLWPLPVERLWGVGPKTKMALNQAGIKNIGDLARTPKQHLQEYFGEHGEHLHNLANGIDPRIVEENDEVKSVSNEHTFDVDTGSVEKIEESLLWLSEKVSRRLRKEELKGRTLTVKIRLKGFKTYTRAFTFAERTNYGDVIYQKARELFYEFYKPGQQIRLIGVRISNFTEAHVQESLFDDVLNDRREKVHKAMDLIRDRFGDEAIHRAG